MRYVAAALLCAMGENEISAANMEKILSSVGVEADKERLSQVGHKHLSCHQKLFKGPMFQMPPGCGSLQGQVH